MSDVLKIALARRSALQDELAKIDEFIRMAETLLSDTPMTKAAAPSDMQLRPSRMTGAEDHDGQRGPGEESFSAPTRPQVIRRNQAG